MPLLTEPKPKSNDTFPWSGELPEIFLYKVATQLSEEEKEDKMDTS